MIPRYKVIADWPGSLSIEVGQIITGNVGEVGAEMFRLDAFPHLFRKLNWWEERKVEDMPEYVKWDVDIYPTWKKIMKVDKWNSNGSFDHENVTISVINCFPATEQQYNDYINSKSNAKH